MLTRIQCSRADDQRGLLTKEQLALPLFLQIPGQQSEEKSEEQNPENIQESRSNTQMKAADKGKPCMNGDHKDSNEEKSKTEQSDCAGSAEETSH